MALRKRLNEQLSDWPLPIRGVNLAVEQSLLGETEAAKMQNFVIDGAMRNRTGSDNINSTSLGAFRITGGTKYYYGGQTNPTSKRIVSYSTNISAITNNGVETQLTTGMTSDKDTHFTSWSITDKLYITNGTDTLRHYDGNTDTFSTVTGTNIPSPVMVVPVLDRLLALTPAGIERSITVNDTTWSDDSAWATLRPSKGGRFTAIHPFTLRGTDSILHGALAFQASAWYLITATHFGGDPSTGATDPDGLDDAAIRLMDDGVGTSSPYGIAEVPELGIFWITSDLNVYFVPYGSLRGQYVGDRLRSVTEVQGIESMSLPDMDQAWLRYKYPYLMLGIPQSGTSPTIQYWMDIRVFAQAGPVWYGPMTGQNLSRVWVEQELNDDWIYGGEGDANTGAFVYRIRKPSTYTDAVGTTDNDITSKWLTFHNDFGAPDKEKLIRSLHFDINPHQGEATIDIYDIDGVQKSNMDVVRFTEF